MTLQPLPIDEALPGIAEALRRSRALVIVAPPGAGKTTRIPPFLSAAGRTIVLQPRRVAARAIAARIAEEQRWTLGGEVGWHVRFERRFSSETRVLLATEGILTARLRSDPLLSDFEIVILDEFHERSLHADLALAMMREVLAARDDLRVVVMSATLDAVRVAAYLEDCPVIEVPGRLHPVAVSYDPSTPMNSAVRAELSAGGGNILCFLPGAREIAATAASLAGIAADIFPLHGTLPAEEQERALAPSTRRKVILATNIAETSLTVEGVTSVIDSGLQRLLLYDPALGIDRLVTRRISADSAEQRAGRAGRTAPGRAIRLWDSRDHLEAHRQPEIERVDLAGAVLDVVAWGGHPFRFHWFERPPEERLQAAVDLLQQLRAIHPATLALTPDGKVLRRLPFHPRLARLVTDAGGSDDAILAAIGIEEGRRSESRSSSTSDSDVFSLIDGMRRAGTYRRQVEEIRRASGGTATPSDPERLLKAIAAAYPDRLGRRREPGSRRLLLASGHGALLATESAVGSGEFLACIDVTGADPRANCPTSEALVRMASLVRREWIRPDTTEVVVRYDKAGRCVRGMETERRGAIVLRERPAEVDPQAAVPILAEELERSWREEGSELLRRAAFARVEVGLTDLAAASVHGSLSLPSLRLADAIPFAARREIERLAPESLELPSGRRTRLHYRDDGSVVAAARLQELFGLAETPRIGPTRTAVIFELLSPGGRPVQTTSDLRSFWDRTYPEVRKELRGRYPRHPWPEDPWNAEPTHRTTRRK